MTQKGTAQPQRTKRVRAEFGVEIMAESIHQKLKRVRKPRVHITYDVETEGAEVLRELPFVVGIMGDFS